MATEDADELTYRVAYVSGEDENGSKSADEPDPDLLNGVTWCSTKYCHYPQEMVLKLRRRANLEKIQILCHSIYVPQKVELYVGNMGAKEKKPSLWKATYDRLGYVTFQPNNDEKTRELKSIYVDASGWFLKLMIHENYPNQKQNPYDQVGLVNIIVSGYYVGGKSSDEDDFFKKRDKKNRGTKEKAKSDREYRDPDKSYTAEMKTVSSFLEQKKKRAVTDERFEYAKQLKSATAELRGAIETVDKLERDKREAVEEEDFDRAIDCKEEIIETRNTAYANINIVDLLTEGEQIKLGLLEPDQADKNRRKKTPHKPEESDQEIVRSPEPTRSRTPLEKAVENEPDPEPVIEGAYARKDSTVLPAISSPPRRRRSLPADKDSADEKAPKERERLPPITGNTFTEEEDKAFLQSLPPSDQALVSQGVNLFGMSLIRKVYSKNWEDRKEGMEELQEKLEEAKSETKDKASYIVHPTLQIIRKGLRDKVYAVYTATQDVLTHLLTEYLPHHKLQKTGGQTAAEKTHYVMITRTGDTSGDSRFRSSSIDYLVNTSVNGDTVIGKAYATHILKPFQATGYPKIDQGHAETAERITNEANVPNDKLGLDEDRVCSYALSCIQHTDPEVRKTGSRMMLNMYRNGDKETVLQYLPPSGSKAALKNSLFKYLFDEIDKIDGKEPRSQRKPIKPGQNSKSATDAQLRELQQQNQKLKEALDKGNSEPDKGNSGQTRPKSGRKRSLGPSNSRRASGSSTTTEK